MIWEVIDTRLMNLQKVNDGGSWSFEQSMLIFHQLKDYEDPHMVKLHEFEIWMQIYDMSRGCVSENIMKNVGQSFGRYIKLDPYNFDGLWKQSMRIR